MNIKKNKELGVYKVGDYKIGDRVRFVNDVEVDELRIEGFSKDGKEVYGVFFSDDCGGGIEFDWIVEKV